MYIKLIFYIFYRFANNILFSTRHFINKIPQINTLINFSYLNITTIEFNFADKNTHLGDRLFFFPLILCLIEKNIKVYINTEDKITQSLFYEIYRINLLESLPCINIDAVVITKPSFFSLNVKRNNLIVINFSDFKCGSRLPIQLILSFEKLLNLDLNIKPFYYEVIDSYHLLEKNDKYFVFNNYIDSGLFRKFFCKQNLLLSKCISLKKDGYKIIHVGSKADVENDKFYYDFVDLDLRGIITPSELIQIIKSKNVHGVISFDNFIMHLNGLYSKKAYILFRGRFTSKATKFHYCYVNNSFYENKSLLEYLN